MRDARRLMWCYHSAYRDMANYDFRTLSGYDFALLARDLLQAKLGVHLESFSAGPDSGIDFRFRRKGMNLIVQCKHYADSGFSALASILRRKERAKIDRLAPTKYALATSVSLTPDRKDDLKEILGPHCLELSDIYGREDLNNLLSQNPEIERRHFKLWLTSEPVLTRILHAGIFSDSQAHLDRIRLRLCRYVQNPSFGRARTMLDKLHYCIISGIPGIGKTTLAEVLLADLVDRQGFESFRIVRSLDEIRAVKNTKNKQVFYFDDFLGKTGLDKLQNNDDQRLIDLIEEVASNPDWRLILTTREYILNSAKFRYEALAQPRVDLTLCTINLADYTAPIRGKILYNHIYFSDLPKEYKLALLRDNAYLSILQHHNYNPRVIEYMTQGQHACAVQPSLYVKEFSDNLAHPIRIWEHAFTCQISEPARHLLLSLATMPDDCLLSDLEEAFWKFYRVRQQKFGFSTGSEDWNRALEELDGSFIATQQAGDEIVVGFHSPSVRDFMEYFLEHSDGDVADLINGAYFYEQYVALWKGKGGRRYAGVDRYGEAFLRELEKSVLGPTASTIRHVGRRGEEVTIKHREVSKESRAEFALRAAREVDGVKKSLSAGTVRALRELWEEHKADREDLVKLLRLLTSGGSDTADGVFLAAKGCVMNECEEIGDFRAVGDFLEVYPDQVSSVDLQRIRAEFLRFAGGYSDGWSDDDPNWLREVAADLQSVGESLEVDVAEFTEQLDAMAKEIEDERANQEDRDYEDDDRWESSPRNDEDVDDMFRSLREELED